MCSEDSTLSTGATRAAFSRSIIEVGVPVDTRFLAGVIAFTVLAEVVEEVAVEALASFEGVVPLLLFFYVTAVGLVGYY